MLNAVSTLTSSRAVRVMRLSVEVYAIEAVSTLTSSRAVRVMRLSVEVYVL